MNSEPHLSDANPEQLVAELLTEFQTARTCHRGRLSRLVELAVSNDERVAEQASTAFFTSLVEALADSFEPAAVSLYNQAFAHLIQACRVTEKGRPLGEKLNDFGLNAEADILRRAERIRTSFLQSGRVWAGLVDQGRHSGSASSEVTRIIMLSRVTLGADVAITSVMMERFKTAFPSAEIVVVGGRKASELFGGDPRVSFKEVSYPRTATAVDRLLSWLPLVDCVGELTGEARRCLIVDPDSRLSQLGLLPLAADDASESGGQQSGGGYLFFPSREYGCDSSASLAELAVAWLDQVLGISQRVLPTVRPARTDLEAAQSVVERIRRPGEPVITINFGVGGNARKRISDDFERQLVASLLRDGATIVLDKGAGADEELRADGVIEFAKRASNDQVRLLELDEQVLSEVPAAERIDAELVVWSGRIGLLAGLIAASDLYIGYDSAGQHIAAALGVPCVDVFAGFSSRRMLERWRPTGRADVRVVMVGQAMTEGEVLAETLRHARG